MRIVCPKCELKGQVDVTPTGAKTRIACVRCATTFDAVFTDGEIQTLSPQVNPVAAFESAGQDVSDAAPMGEPATETPQESHADATPQLETQPDLIDDFSTPSPNLILKESLETSTATPQEAAEEFAQMSGENSLPEMPSGGKSFDDAAAAVKSGGTGKLNRPPADAYALGVRLMRVSPLWLLLTGLSFISFIVLCNWLIKPVEQTNDAASMLVAANTRATNQAQSRLAVQNSTAQSPVNTQPVAPSSESGAAFIPAQARETPAPQTAPVAEALKEKPPVEEKAATPASKPSPSANAKEGKVTIQIGSYNESAQAEERVASLKSAGYEARSVSVEIPKRGTWYRVQSGRFVSRDEAERYGRQLRDKGVVASFITTDVQE